MDILGQVVAGKLLPVRLGVAVAVAEGALSAHFLGPRSLVGLALVTRAVVRQLLEGRAHSGGHVAAVTRPRPLGLGARRWASARPPPDLLPARVPSRALAAPGLGAGLGPRRRCRLLPPAPAGPRSEGPSRRLDRSAPAALPLAARALPARRPRAPVGPRDARRPASRCPGRDRRAACPAAPVPLSLSLSAASFTS